MIKEKRLNSAFIFSLALGFVAVLTLSSAASGVNGFDEPIQFIGLASVLEHAQKVFQLKSPDFTAIHFNLEFYGIAPRIPGYLLWTVAKLFAKLIDPFENLGLSAHTGPGLRDAYRSGYFAISHIVSVSYLIGTSIVVNKVTKKLGVAHHEFAGVMTLFFPALLGFSLISVKDPAFAFFYSLYSYVMASSWEQLCGIAANGKQNDKSRQAYFHGFMAGLMVSTYASSLFLVIVSEAVMAAIFFRRYQCSFKKFINHLMIGAVIAGLTWFILSPPAWSQPLRFLIESVRFSLDGSQAWGGCTNFLSTCTRKGEDWSILKYLANWLFSTMPLLHLLGLGLAAVFSVAAIKDLALSRTRISAQVGKIETSKIFNPFLWAFALQASVIPIALIIKNGFIFDSVRHILFLLPPLTIFSYLGLTQAFAYCRGRAQRLVLTLATGIMAFSLAVNVILLHPYQYTYFNELAIARGVNWKNTDIDFYYASDAESLRNFMKTKVFKHFASEGGLDVKGAPPMENAYLVEHFPRKKGHKYFFTNHTREPGVSLRKDCEQAGKQVIRKQLIGPVNIYGTPQVCLASSYRDWDPF